MVLRQRQRDQSDNGDDPANTDIRLMARKALQQLMDPLAEFVLASGISAGEFNAIFREAAIRAAAAKQLETSDRVNISGIAATTGISRAEISRTLKNSAKTSEDKSVSHQQSTSRILAAWHEDPKFMDQDGQPCELKIYGRGKTFDALARKYGLGITTRAVLDELMRAGTIELLPNQKIRAKTSTPVARDMSVSAVKAYGDRATELLSTMLLNMRRPERPNFVASMSETSIGCSSLALFQRELSTKGSIFLADLQDSRVRSSPPFFAGRLMIVDPLLGEAIQLVELFL